MDDYLTKQGWVRSKRQIVAKAKELHLADNQSVIYLIAELFSDTTDQIRRQINHNA